ncbi:MAG: hypothetical protein RSD08_05335, partial [Oscillospiraceae bacterium]
LLEYYVATGLEPLGEKHMRVYNLTPQREDSRDAKLNQTMLGPIPMSVDLRPLCPPVFNQGELGSCTANAGVGCGAHDADKR